MSKVAGLPYLTRATWRRIINAHWEGRLHLLSARAGGRKMVLSRSMFKTIRIFVVPFGDLEFRSYFAIGDLFRIKGNKFREATAREFVINVLLMMLEKPKLDASAFDSLPEIVLERVAKRYLEEVFPMRTIGAGAELYDTFRLIVQDEADADMRGLIKTIDSAVSGFRSGMLSLGKAVDIPKLGAAAYSMNEQINNALRLADRAEQPIISHEEADHAEIADGRWAKVDRQIGKARQGLSEAIDEEDFQAIGLICREIMISLAETVYRQEDHKAVDGTEPSSADAGRKLAAYIAAELPGKTNEEARSAARASLRNAVAVQHDRNATKLKAAICLITTEAVVDIIMAVDSASGVPG